VLYGDARLPERIWIKIYPEPNTGCWLWGASCTGGYGNLCTNKKVYRASRYLLFIETGVLGVQALHNCLTRQCCNPDHLRWGNNSENQLDSVKDGTHLWARKTRCPKKHLYSEENTYWVKNPVRRICLTCKRETDKVNAQKYRDRLKTQREASH